MNQAGEINKCLSVYYHILSNQYDENHPQSRVQVSIDFYVSF
jgi:hypothetical protein